MMQTTPPLGLLLGRAAKSVQRAFDEALVEAGGSLPLWLILLSMMRGGRLSHGDLARQVGIQGPTLTHHLDGLESRGLVRRDRDPDNRRVQYASLTGEGVALFHRLRVAAQAHDARLRAGLSAEEEALLRRLLVKLADNVAERGPP